MIYYESQYYGVQPVGDNIEHHGIKGQKWGVRKYQNPDGTLTPAGKARYGTEENFKKAQDYKSGLRDATIAGGLIGRAIYKKKHARPEEDKEAGKKVLASEKANDKAKRMAEHFDKNGKMKIHSSDTSVTKEVKKDYNNLSDREFARKYAGSKKVYAKRVLKYGDPYKHVKEKLKLKDDYKAHKETRDIKESRDRQDVRAVHKVKRAVTRNAANFTSAVAAGTGHHVTATAAQVGRHVANTKDRVQQHREIKSMKETYKQDVAELKKKYKRS